MAQDKQTGLGDELFGTPMAESGRSNGPSLSYKTRLGKMVLGTTEGFVESSIGSRYTGKVQLIFTSPPFPLNRKKKYGNEQGEQYIRWLSTFAPVFRDLLVPDGSVVIELGNAWEPGRPVMSTLALRALLAFLDKGQYSLCQQFVCHNPARLPTPVQWVNVERIRVKDSFTNVWWMSPTDRPKANNRRVLREYSPAMVKLLQSRQYNAGARPSEHHIGHTSFLRDHGGAIPSNVLSFANTSASDDYQRYCRERGLKLHPARMPVGLAEFFIEFLSDSGDLVFDPFAGSNTTGGAEVDVIFEGIRLMLSRWQVQCRNTPMPTVDDVAREVGFLRYFRSDVGVVVSTAAIVPKAVEFAGIARRRIRQRVALIDGQTVRSLDRKPTVLTCAVQRQAPGALELAS